MRAPVFLAIMVCALGGCAMLGDGYSPAPPLRQETLKPGDSLRITVAGEEELSGLFAVNPDGAVRMELLGAVPASGLSLPGFEQALRKRLAAGYLKDPQVLVSRAADPVAARSSPATPTLATPPTSASPKLTAPTSAPPKMTRDVLLLGPPVLRQSQ